MKKKKEEIAQKVVERVSFAGCQIQNCLPGAADGDGVAARDLERSKKYLQEYSSRT